ncbi:MAG TPA: hypothetical protein VFK48_02970 [Usitatibacter sp.]|nr:hypothetical protein [Usitatibacter sp.]
MSAADLFVLLDREYRKRRPRDCAACFVQLPYRVDTGAGEADANWDILLPADCGNGCGAMLEDMVAEFKARYELKVTERQ